MQLLCFRIQFLGIDQQKQNLVLFPNSVSHRGKGNDGTALPTAKGPTLIKKKKKKQLLMAHDHNKVVILAFEMSSHLPRSEWHVAAWQFTKCKPSRPVLKDATRFFYICAVLLWEALT